jgi:hypothetical protein
MEVRIMATAKPSTHAEQVTVWITAVIEGEYKRRNVFPELILENAIRHKGTTGIHSVSIARAHEIYNDATNQSDDLPPGVKTAYWHLHTNIRRGISDSDLVQAVTAPTKALAAKYRAIAAKLPYAAQPAPLPIPPMSFSIPADMVAQMIACYGLAARALIDLGIKAEESSKLARTFEDVARLRDSLAEITGRLASMAPDECKDGIAFSAKEIKHRVFSELMAAAGSWDYWRSNEAEKRPKIKLPKVDPAFGQFMQLTLRRGKRSRKAPLPDSGTRPH